MAIDTLSLRSGTKIKVMSYNVFNGLVNDYTGSYDKKREQAAMDVISDYDPDILIMPEANFSTDKIMSRRNYDNVFGDLFRFNGHARSITNRWVTAILSKYPLESQDRTLPCKSNVRAYIDIDGKPIIVDGVHPISSRQNPLITSRMKADWFKEEVLTDIDSSYVIAGDFNALSPEDTYCKSGLIEGYAEFLLGKAKWTIEDMLEANEIDFLISQGLIDTFRAKNDYQDYTMPTGLRHNNKSRVRIDHIFCSSDLVILDSGIMRTPETEIASDHRPVWVELEI